MITSQPPDHVMNIYNFISPIIRLTATNLSRMGDQCSLTLHNLHMILISIPLCPVINVDGFISISIQDVRTKYNILTLQAMIASPELSHRKKVTGFIHPHSKALYPLSESYNNINWQDCRPTCAIVIQQVMTISSPQQHATRRNLSLLSCLV